MLQPKKTKRRYSLHEYKDIIHDVRGSHIRIVDKSFSTVFAGSMVIATCEKHDHSFTCLAASLIDDSFSHPCPKCKDLLMIKRKVTHTEDDFRRIISEIQKHYKDKPYSYEHSEESYFQSLGGEDARRISVFCKKHNFKFTKTRVDHLKNSGCPKCSKETILGKHKMVYATREELVAGIEKVNVLQFDLSRVEFSTVRQSKQWVKCKHGWKQTWTVTLLSGGGCQRCSADRMWQIRKQT
jgi:ribosomal protein S27AE